MSRISFVERALKGKVLVPAEEIDDEIDLWTKTETDEPLATWLGMTSEEYALWVEKSAVLGAILMAHHLHLNVKDVLNFAESSITSMAARGMGMTPQDQAVLYQWLKKTGRL